MNIIFAILVGTVLLSVIALPPLLLFDRYVVVSTTYALPYPANEGECVSAQKQWPRIGIEMYSGDVLVVPLKDKGSAKFVNGVWREVTAC